MESKGVYGWGHFNHITRLVTNDLLCRGCKELPRMHCLGDFPNSLGENVKDCQHKVMDLESSRGIQS